MGNGDNPPQTLRLDIKFPQGRSDTPRQGRRSAAPEPGIRTYYGISPIARY
jgi:hypothetical protein